MIQRSFVALKVVRQHTTTILASPTTTIKDEMYHYKNLSEDAKSSSNMQETIPGTYEFINSHGGFLNEDYRLFKTDNRTGKLTYQRFLNGHPTFNKQNFNEIQVTWG